MPDCILSARRFFPVINRFTTCPRVRARVLSNDKRTLAKDRSGRNLPNVGEFFAMFSALTLAAYGLASFIFRAMRLLRIKARQAAGATQP